ncbi:MAG: PrsW family glutamic-type intramembrane protease [Nitrospirales bacterium]
MSEQDVFLICIAGPDRGKRLALRDGEVMLGRSTQCHLLSEDREVTEHHVVFSLNHNHAYFHTLNDSPIFVDGHRTMEGRITDNQQLRIGRSVWQLGGDLSHGGIPDWLDHIGGQISSVAGLERVKGFNFWDMFSEVIRKRKDEEVEDYFHVGTLATTPALWEINTAWPKPWVFFKVFVVSLVVYLGFVFALNMFNNIKLVPGLIITGSFMIPFALLIFFFEVNVARNISLYQVIKLVFFGGILSLILSLFLFRTTGLHSWLGAASAGIIEEIGKAGALLLVVTKLQYRWTLNGMLFGAAVGAGFASFESAGYALERLLAYGGGAMLDNITHRGFLSMVGGHVLWTSMVGAALWRIRGDRNFTFEMVKDPRFLRVLGIAMALHMIWNMPFTLPLYLKEISLGFIAWVVILGLIQDGLNQIHKAQQEYLASKPIESS